MYETVYETDHREAGMKNTLADAATTVAYDPAASDAVPAAIDDIFVGLVPNICY